MIGFAGTSFGFVSESDSIDYFSDPDYKIFSVIEGIHEYRVPYKISGAELNTMDLDCDGTELIIGLENAKDGTLIINIPRKMLDTRFNNSDDNFFVLLDGKEVDFKENYSDIESRTLKIPFFKDSQVLEIIITQLISQFPENEVSCGEGSEESPYYHLLSPLKQFKSGITVEEIKCKESLQLIQKKDSSPACVSYETAIKLDSRGWSFPIWTGGPGEEVFSSTISKIDSHKDCMNSDKKLVYEGTTNTTPYIVSIGWNPYDLKTSQTVNFEIQMFDVDFTPLQNVTYDFVWKTGPDSGVVNDRYVEDFGKIGFDVLPIKTADPCYIAVSVHIDKIGEKSFKRDPVEIEKYGNMSPVAIQFHHYSLD